ncbi:MAG: alpha/beta hydrolase, partial [Thermoleophilia bacterium]|nr:alpha/beta hydrolase [Thermoleophilia bacterium]
MPLDPEVREYLDRLAAAGVPPVTELTPAEARRNTEAAAPGLFGTVEPIGAV